MMKDYYGDFLNYVQHPQNDCGKVGDISLISFRQLAGHHRGRE